MELNLKVVGETVHELGDQLYAMSLGFMGDAHPANQPKGLANHTDDELLAELMSRGVSPLTNGQPAVSEDKPKGKRTPKKEEPAAVEETGDPTDAQPEAEEKSEDKKVVELTPQKAYDEAMDIAMKLYSGKAKDAVMALLKDFNVKTFRDIDAETDGLAFYQKVKELQEQQG